MMVSSASKMLCKDAVQRLCCAKMVVAGGGCCCVCVCEGVRGCGWVCVCAVVLMLSADSSVGPLARPTHWAPSSSPPCWAAPIATRSHYPAAILAVLTSTQQPQERRQMMIVWVFECVFEYVCGVCVCVCGYLIVCVHMNMRLRTTMGNRGQRRRLEADADDDDGDGDDG